MAATPIFRLFAEWVFFLSTTPGVGLHNSLSIYPDLTMETIEESRHNMCADSKPPTQNMRTCDPNIQTFSTGRKCPQCNKIERIGQRLPVDNLAKQNDTNFMKFN